MTFVEILKNPVRMLARHGRLFLFGFLVLLCATFYPTDLERDYATSKGGKNSELVVGVEEYGRHINTVLPIATALLLRDWTGLKQIAVIVVAGTVASHGPKRFLNNVEIMGTRLGQRPNSPTSKHNMPSGHSTLASAGGYLMMRRYSLWFGLLVLPVTFLTMYARYMLDAHTVSATIAGFLVGAIITALFSTKYPGFHAHVRRLVKRQQD